MAHGAPDYSNIRKETIAHTLDDLAELAIRLNAPIGGERTGEYIFIENFENGLSRWRSYGNVSGFSFDLVTDTAQSGAFAARINPKSGGLNWVAIDTFLSHFQQLKTGLDAFLAFDMYIDYVDMKLLQYTGTNLYTGILRMNIADSLLQYIDEADNPVDIDEINFSYNFLTYYRYVKLVVDLETHCFHRVVFDNTIYDLSGIDLKLEPSTKTPCLSAQFLMLPIAVIPQYLWIDRVVITNNDI